MKEGYEKLSWASLSNLHCTLPISSSTIVPSSGQILWSVSPPVTREIRVLFPDGEEHFFTLNCVSGERGAHCVPDLLAGEGRRGAVGAAGREGQEDRRGPQEEPGTTDGSNSKLPSRNLSGASKVVHLVEDKLLLTLN